MAPPGEESDKSQPLTYLEFLRRICAIKKKSLKSLLKIEPPPKIESDSKFTACLKYPGFLATILSIAEFNCVIFIHTGVKNTFRVVFDATFLPLAVAAATTKTHFAHHKIDKNSKNVKYLFFRKNGVLMGVGTSDKKRGKIRKRIPAKFRLEILHCPPQEDEIETLFPHFGGGKSIDEFLKYIKECNLEEKYCIFYVFSWAPVKSCTATGTPYRELVHKNFQRDADILELYYNTKRKLCYKLTPGTCCKNAEKITPVSELQFSRQEFKRRNNRQTSIFVKHEGLNLALILGLVTRDEFISLSTFCAKMSGFITCKINAENNQVQEIRYKDFSVDLISFSVPHEWDSLFSLIEHQASVAKLAKYKMLSGLLAKLSAFQNCEIGSPHKQCFVSLQSFCNKFKVFSFSTDDTLMHLLKVPMALYFRKKYPKSKCSVFLKCSKGNDILSLLYKRYSIINMAQITGAGNSNFNQTSAVLKEACKSWSSVEHVDDLSNLSCLYSNINNHCLLNHCCDISTLSFLSMAQLSNLIFWSRYLFASGGSWLMHPIEQTMASNQEKVRNFCRGGFSFSAKREICAGGEISHGNVANMLINLDIVASYGYAASTMSAAGGFGATFENGERLETSKRYKFFEFRAVFYSIYCWENIQNKNILASFHNYSPYGVFYIGKYPIDLVTIFKDGTMEIVQFDSAYCHGCNCCILPSYADGKSRTELYEKTQTRDEYTIRWISHTGIKANYRIVTDCCNEEFKKSNLDRQFATVPQLKNLISGYSSIVSDNLENVHSEITFLAIAKLNFFSDNYKFGPFFDNTENASKTVLLTKDYFNYLKNNFPRVKIEKVEWVVFYKRDYIFNLVYRDLLTRREIYTQNVKQFYKNVINLSCGYFGTNLNKSKTRCLRITNKTPHNFNLEQYSIITLDPNPENLYILKTNLPKKNYTFKNRATSFSVIHFATIIEFGKMRLNQIFKFFQDCLRPNSFDILYTHVDSIIMTIDSPTILEACKNKQLFYLQGNHFFGREPGKLKIVWNKNREDEWSFVTCRQSSYALECNQTSIAKMPSVSSDCPSNIYLAQANILSKKQTNLLQHRRINKLQGLNTAQQNFCFF